MLKEVVLLEVQLIGYVSHIFGAKLLSTVVKNLVLQAMLLSLRLIYGGIGTKTEASSVYDDIF